MAWHAEGMLDLPRLHRGRSFYFLCLALSGYFNFQYGSDLFVVKEDRSTQLGTTSSIAACLANSFNSRVISTCSIPPAMFSCTLCWSQIVSALFLVTSSMYGTLCCPPVHFGEHQGTVLHLFHGFGSVQLQLCV